MSPFLPKKKNVPVSALVSALDEKIALLMAREARERIEDLLSYGVPFDKDLEGRLDLGREAAHGRNRILHVKGDTADVRIYMTRGDSRALVTFHLNRDDHRWTISGWTY